MAEELDELMRLPEEYTTRLEKALERVKTSEVEATDAIDYFMEPFIKDLSPDLLSMDKTRGAFLATLGVVSGMPEEEVFLKVKGLEEPALLKYRMPYIPSFLSPSLLGFFLKLFPSSLLKYAMRVFPIPIEFTPASEGEIEEMPGMEIDVDVLPPLLSGDMDQIFDTLSERGRIKIHKAPTLVDWLDGEMDMSNYVPLLDLLEKNTIKKVKEQLLPALDKSLERFGV